MPVLLMMSFPTTKEVTNPRSATDKFFVIMPPGGLKDHTFTPVPMRDPGITKGILESAQNRLREHTRMLWLQQVPNNVAHCLFIQPLEAGHQGSGEQSSMRPWCCCCWG